MKTSPMCWLVPLIAAVISDVAAAQTALTYQGDLQEGGEPANGSYDFDFTLWDALAGGSQVGGPINVPNVLVTDGTFTVELDFGADAFDNTSRWLEIDVDGVPLLPRQPITRTPYALQTRGLFVSDSGNIGIGTTDPQEQVELSAGEAVLKLTATDETIGRTSRLQFQGSGNQSIFHPIGSLEYLTDDGALRGSMIMNRIGQLYINTAPGEIYQLLITEGLVRATGELELRSNVSLDLVSELGSEGNDSFLNLEGGSVWIGAATELGTEGTDSTFQQEGGSLRVDTATTLGTNGANSYLQLDGGNVGVGTTGPAAKLHVHGDGNESIRATNPSGDGLLGWSTATSGTHYGVYGIASSDDGIGVNGYCDSGIGVQGGSIAFRGVYGTSISGNGVYGRTSSANGVIGWADGNSGVNRGVIGTTDSVDGYGVYSSGDFGGNGAKYFVQPHPTDPSKQVRFVCLEGNESGTYFRGTAQLEDGRAYIEVPEEFRLVSEAEGLTVQLTARGPDAGLWVESSDLDRIVVNGNGNVEFDYFVNGVRRGFANHTSIQPNHGYVPEVRGLPYGSQYRPEHRRILVENGILNPDFTPNEATAERLGWELRDPTEEDLR